MKDIISSLKWERQQIHGIFSKKWHAEPGTKKVLGKVIPAGKGGLRHLTDFLASHENTIMFISFKLAEHFG